MSRLALGLVVAAGLAAAPAIPAQAIAAPVVAGARPAVAIPTTTLGPPITRSQILMRAQSWVDAKVSYSESAHYTNAYGTYRTDCSGFVSMAWGLPTNGESGWGLSTRTLPDVAVPISKDDLQPGDMLDFESTHVVLFTGWINKSAGTFRHSEETTYGSYAISTTDNINGPTIAGWPASSYHAYRYKNVRNDTGAGVGVQADGKRVFFANSAGQLQNDWYASDTWNGPANIGTAHTTGPVAVTPDGNNLFYTETNGRIGTAWNDSTGWHNSVLAGSGTDITTATTTSGTTEIFYRSPSGQIQSQWNSGNGWQGPENIGTATTDGPINASPDGTSIYYHDATQNRIGTAWRTTTGAWDNSVLAGNGTDFASTKLGNTTEIFYRSPSGQIQSQWNSGNGWQGPENIGTATTDGPINADSTGTSIYYHDATQNRIGTAWRTTTGAWDNSVLPGNGTAPTGTTPANATRRVFYRDTDGTIQNDWYTASGWQGPAPTGGGN